VEVVPAVIIPVMVLVMVRTHPLALAVVVEAVHLDQDYGVEVLEVQAY
jgi:hypothetical protein